ncbi:MAG: alanine racemase, partial [Betaproteobacteria bacterium]
LIANQIVGSDQLRRLATLNRTARVVATVDAPVHIKLLATAAAQAGVVIPVVVEVDVGLRRAGVSTAGAALDLAQIMLSNEYLNFCGVMAWEGQTTRIPDPQAKALAIHDAVAILVDTASHCMAAGVEVEIVSCGGTGTYPVSSKIEGVTEIQAGGGVFGDVRCRTEFHMPLEPALKLCATVISRPTERRIVCDAGWKYHGCHPTLSRVIGLAGVCHVAYAAEHLTLECESDIASFAVGERIELAVGYADSTVFLHRELLAMRKGEIEEVLVLPTHS